MFVLKHETERPTAKPALFFCPLVLRLVLLRSHTCVPSSKFGCTLFVQLSFSRIFWFLACTLHNSYESLCQFTLVSEPHLCTWRTQDSQLLLKATRGLQLLLYVLLYLFSFSRMIGSQRPHTRRLCLGCPRVCQQEVKEKTMSECGSQVRVYRTEVCFGLIISDFLRSSLGTWPPAFEKQNFEMTAQLGNLVVSWLLPEVCPFSEISNRRINLEKGHLCT